MTENKETNKKTKSLDDKSKKKRRSGITTVFSYALKSKRDFILTIIFMILGTFVLVLVPAIIRIIIDGVSDPVDPITSTRLTSLIFTGISIALIASAIQGISRMFSAFVGTKAQYYARKDVFEAINRQSYSYFDKNSVGDLVSITTSDIEMLTPVFNQGITLSIQSGITLIAVVIAAFFMEKGLAIFFFINITIYALIIVLAYKKMAPAYYDSRLSFGNLTTTFRENLIGAQVVRIFDGKKKELKKFKEDNDKFRDDLIKTILWQIILRYSGLILTGSLIIFTFFYGGPQVIRREMTSGTLVGLLSYSSMLGLPIIMLNNVVNQFVQANAAMERVLQVIRSKPEMQNISNSISAENIKGEVEFKDVSFSYLNGNYVLEDLNFHVNNGENIAIVGTTGSGKSTLINLIPRYYDTNQGQVIINGTDIRNYEMQSLRKQVGYCSQEVFLFNISIADNIRFGVENASLEDVIEAAKSANIHDFIQSLPHGYDTIVGERGTSLSGGQKQRVAIARALIRKPKILILDDSTSALDTETEFKIQQALEKVMVGRTSFIITQRVSNLNNADRIIVMDKGKMIAFGSHEDLFQSNLLYTQIYNTLFEKQKEADYTLNKLKEEKQ